MKAMMQSRAQVLTVSAGYSQGVRSCEQVLDAPSERISKVRIGAQGELPLIGTGLLHGLSVKAKSLASLIAQRKWTNHRQLTIKHISTTTSRVV
jgi:hypothetical protein